MWVSSISEKRVIIYDSCSLKVLNFELNLHLPTSERKDHIFAYAIAHKITEYAAFVVCS